MVAFREPRVRPSAASVFLLILALVFANAGVGFANPQTVGDGLRCVGSGLVCIALAVFSYVWRDA